MAAVCYEVLGSMKESYNTSSKYVNAFAPVATVMGQKHAQVSTLWRNFMTDAWKQLLQRFGDQVVTNILRYCVLLKWNDSSRCWLQLTGPSVREISKAMPKPAFDAEERHQRRLNLSRSLPHSIRDMVAPAPKRRKVAEDPYAVLSIGAPMSHLTRL
jgi:hypothetical protein